MSNTFARRELWDMIGEQGACLDERGKGSVFGDRPRKLCWRQITGSVGFQATEFGLYFVGSE